MKVIADGKFLAKEKGLEKTSHPVHLHFCEYIELVIVFQSYCE